MTNSTAAEQPSPAVRQRVLVIDDEPVVGASIRRILAPDGYEIDTYTDPEAGLRAALSGGFDVVFLDLQMPGLSGLDVLRAIKAAGTMRGRTTAQSPPFTSTSGDRARVL